MLEPFLLRKIRKSKWYQNEGVPWLLEGELQADALGDLATKNNELSVWYVEGNQSNLERIITALAATAQSFSNFDYTLLEERIFAELNIRIRPSRGNTPDEEANAFWHRDLHELSAHKLVELAQAILNQGEKRRISEREIRQWIAQAVATGQIEREKLQPKVRSEIDKVVPSN